MKVSCIRRSLCAALAATGCVGSPAYAVNSSVSFESRPGILGTDAAYAGSFTVSGNTLRLRVKTHGSSGAHLTGVAFNAPAGAITGMASAPDHFKLLERSSAAPFGVYTSGAALNGHWQAGGAAADGVALGSSVTFVYTLSSDAYQASDFWSDACTQAQGCNAFTARFRSPGEGAGDKVAATQIPVPEPETYALMLAGVGLIGFIARRRRPD